MDVATRKSYGGKRFGKLNPEILGDLSTLEEIVFPDIVETVEVKGHMLTYKMVDIEKEADRAAEIYRNGWDEGHANDEYDWHFRAQGLKDHVATGDWALYGIYVGEKLISCTSVHIYRGMRQIKFHLGVIDSAYRGYGGWTHAGKFFDRVGRESGAHMGLGDAVTTHPYTQRTLEAAGWRPWGGYYSGEFLGGSDGKYYRGSMVFYYKLWGDGAKYVQPRENMILTPMAAKVMDTVLGNGVAVDQ